MTADSWIVEYTRIPEVVVPGKPLGRHVKHDSRSKAYRHQRRHDSDLVSVVHERLIPILNQGDVGSCTGNAECGALGCDPCFSALDGTHQQASVKTGEPFALALYSSAETIDGDGPYPPQDNGSCGLSVCQAAKTNGFISGYTHCMDTADVLDALQDYAVILGTNWYTSFDTPGPGGLIEITPGATVRGGHETLWRGIDVEAQTISGDNSWGTSWGVDGSMSMSWATLTRLLAEQGDCTVSIPLSEPAPVPVLA